MAIGYFVALAVAVGVVVVFLIGGSGWRWLAKRHRAVTTFQVIAG